MNKLSIKRKEKRSDLCYRLKGGEFEMKRGIIKLIAVILILFLAIGCSTTRTIKSGEILKITRQATIVTRNNANIPARQVHINQDSSMAIISQLNHKLYFLNSDIKGIVVKNRIGGFFGGCLMGTLIGGAGGAFLGYVTTEQDFELPDKEIAAYIWGIYGLPIGACVGAIMGTAIGINKTYHFEAHKTNRDSNSEEKL